MSVCVRAGFQVSDDDTQFPNIGIVCLLHLPAEPLRGDGGRMRDLGVAGLSPADGVYDLGNSVTTIAATPNLIHEEAHYEAPLVAAGYSLLFELDEDRNSFEFLNGDYPFSYGAVYFYGRRNEDGAEYSSARCGFGPCAVSARAGPFFVCG